MLIKIISKIKSIGKEIIVVSENPEFDHDPRTAFTRTFNGLQWNMDRLKLKKKDVLEWQKPNLEAMDRVSKETGVKILSSIDAFCPTEDCLVLNEEHLPLFLDEDHVSVVGANFRQKNYRTSVGVGHYPIRLKVIPIVWVTIVDYYKYAY